MATLKAKSNIQMTTQGMTVSGKQGPTTAGFEVPLEITVTGLAHGGPGTLGTGITAAVLWNSADDDPTTFEYFWYCGDQDATIQLMTAGTNVRLGVRANAPFSLGKSLLLAAADTTAMTTAAGSTVAIASIRVFQSSGSTMNYVSWTVK